MKRIRRNALLLQLFLAVVAIGLLAANMCDEDDDGGGTDARDTAEESGPEDSAAEADDDSGGGELQWYLTCGDPACSAHRDHPGVPLCDTEEAGARCTDRDGTCDPVNDCNALLLCTDTDPTTGPGGCPISSRLAKRDIVYLDEAARERLHDDLMSIDLATYHYLDEPDSARRHLGFIIEDRGDGVGVDAGGRRVDLYGYASLAVAAIQVQASEIESLRAELEALRSEVAALRDQVQMLRAQAGPTQPEVGP